MNESCFMSHAHRVNKKRQINGKVGGEIRAERGKRALILRPQGLPPPFLKTVFNNEASPQVRFQSPFLVEKYLFRMSSIEKWYPSK